MTIVPLYKAILASMGCTVDKDGLVSMDISGLVAPVSVEGRRLTIPTPERLRFGDWSETVAFHPLSENLVRGESPVLQTFKNIISIHLHTVVHELLLQLITLGYETHRHSKLSPKAQEVLSAIPDVDQKSVDAMINLIEQAGPDSASNRLIGIFLKRNGLYRGSRYSRVARVSFPLLEQFESPDQPGIVAGIKLRRKDFQNFQNLIQYIFPDALDMDKYSAPSTSMVAPNFDALLQAFLKLARRLNYVVETHREHLDDPEKLLIDTSWEDQVSDLSVYNGQIPSLSGNEGVLLEPENASKPVIATAVPGFTTPSRPEPAPAPPSLPTAPAKSIFNTDLSAAMTPAPAPAPQQPAKKPGGIDFNAAMEARARAASGFHPVQPAPAPAHYPQPMQYPQAPQYAQPAPVQYHRGLPVANYPTPAVPGLPPGMHPANAPAWMMTNDSRIGIGTTGAAPLQVGNQQPAYLNPAFVNPGYGNPGYGAPAYGQPAWGSSAV